MHKKICAFRVEGSSSTAPALVCRDGRAFSFGEGSARDAPAEPLIWIEEELLHPYP